MPEDDLETTQRELAGARAERDALRRQFDDLTARLRFELGVATDADIVGEVRRIRAELAEFRATEEADERRWAGIDSLIVGNRKIHAIQAIRAEFGAGLQLALELLDERHARLRRRTPDRFGTVADTDRYAWES
ncbi:hypothetical protein ACIRBX_32210 [Kitasatospora sp. NPDC096147]|uniref:hypothetical protein n=1 Tax=Kitasatospora sp. NPDC096147 TaxID=3364093 RepID=UPI00382891E0